MRKTLGRLFASTDRSPGNNGWAPPAEVPGLASGEQCPPLMTTGCVRPFYFAAPTSSRLLLASDDPASSASISRSSLLSVLLRQTAQATPTMQTTPTT